MRIIVFETAEERAVGLQNRRYIEEETLFLFAEIGPGDTFHSQNVPEPFDLAFLDGGGRVLVVYGMRPPHDLVEAPPGAVRALEAKGGRMARWGIVNGSVVSVAP